MKTPVTPEQHEEFLRQLQNIPSLPMCVIQLIKTIEDDRTSAGDVAAVLEKDIGLAAKALRLANSPLYGLRSQVSSVSHAVSMLGFKTVKEIAFAASLFDMFDSDRSRNPKALWRHSICCALSSRVLARQLPLEDPEGIFAAALVHDVGKLITLQSVPHSFRQVVERSDAEGLPFREAERLILGTDHTFIGAGVCEQWQLPPLFAICARHHHDPQEVPRDDRPLSQAATIVHMGNWLAHRVLDDRRTEEPEYRWLEEIERRAPILDTAAEEVGEQLEDMEAAFGLHEEHDA